MTSRISTIIYAVALVLAVWIALDFYKAYTSSATIELPRLTQEQVPSAPQEPGHPLSYYAVIEERNLFSRESADGGSALSPQGTTPSDLAEGPLGGKVRLLGTAIMEGGEDYAVLELASTREQQLCKVGDEVEGIEVIDIALNQVTARYGDKEETLTYIPDEVSAPVGPLQGPQARPPQASGPSYFGRTITEDEVLRCAQTIDSLLASAGAEEFSKSDQPYGVRLARVDVRSCLGRMGLRGGDIILGVNDRTVTSVSDAADAIADLSGSNVDACQFRVDRNGWPRTYHLRIQR